MQYFKTIFLEDVEDFLDSLDFKSQKKVVYNVRMAEQTNDPELFKKLNNDIWEFRTKYLGKQIRLLAFWDKTNDTETLVLSTSGFIKKTQKTPKNEIDRAERIRKQYFEEKEQEQKNLKNK
ncbi:type II toxin-antitoxin system RelE/ParE family toxin [Capnocytophaga sputigena]|uniref:type II toxin-antitoxin system RelE/ParE family toxin n=1 Tax=Capnocytophaga sputigena TaxID=1019 RepID=UPI0028F09343|nr:type II toxin-antitoxin system RelE/ParE family toxin [Capnocytophaga sputigena]